jgi:YVTN family beta-propeller protein
MDVNLSKDGTLAYVTNESGNSVSVIDTDPTSAT